MRAQLHSPPVSAPGRQISACLAVVAAALVMLGCGSSSDVTGADIDPNTATDLSGQLDRIQGFFDDGNCDRANKAVDNLRTAIDAVSGTTGEEFTKNALELTDKLAKQVEDQCVPAVPTTTTEETIDTEPTTTETTDTVPTTTETTTKSTTTTTTKSTTTTTPEPPTGPPGNPGNPNGNGPGGGVAPGGGKKENPRRIKKPKPKDKHESKKGGKAKADKRERSR